MKLKEKLNKDNIFFTSDTHFSHSNIIKYCNRPFTTVKEMDDTIINNWNTKVPIGSTVFHLGDLSLGSSKKYLDKLLYDLNGDIHLIVGNHEKDALEQKRRFENISDIMEIFVEDEEITYKEQHIILCHYPMIVWNGSHRGSWQLFGHVHGGLSNKGMIQHKPAQLDVGVDSHNYTPISYQEVKEIITKQHMK